MILRPSRAQATLGALVAAPLACLAYAVAAAPFRPRLRRCVVGVPADWPAISILHLSDLHVHVGRDRLFEAQRQLLAGAAPDVVVITGDLCETIDDVDRALALLGVLRPRFGTFAVLGNHEHLAHHSRLAQPGRSPLWIRVARRVLEAIFADPKGGSGQAFGIARRLSAGGITVLINRGVRLDVDGVPIWIAGSDSAWGGGADVAAAMCGRAADEACLALVHEPELAFPAQQLGADLILAGHTHGGQVRLPIVGAVYTHRVDPRIRIASGFQRIGASLLHISAGLGHTIPLRFDCPPEAVWLDCVPAPPGVMSRRPNCAGRVSALGRGQ